MEKLSLLPLRFAPSPFERFNLFRLKTHQHIHLPDDPAKVPKWLYLDLEFVRSGNKVLCFHAQRSYFIPLFWTVSQEKR